MSSDSKPLWALDVLDPLPQLPAASLHRPRSTEEEMILGRKVMRYCLYWRRRLRQSDRGYRGGQNMSSQESITYHIWLLGRESSGC